MRKLALSLLGFVALLGFGANVRAGITDSIRFSILDVFLAQPASPDTETIVVEPAESLARVLAGYYAATDTIADDFSALPNPLSIPNPFDLSVGRSAELLDRITSRLRQYGIAFDISYPADFPEAEEVIARHISTGFPVLALHPHPIMLFGYDYREPDPFWYIQRFSPRGEIEISTRSQWRRQWWLWEAEPTSVILLEITGPATATTAPSDPKEIMTKLLTNAKTDTATGVTSYIRPILRMIDSLSQAPATPQIVNPPEDPQDPLGLHRAEVQHTRLVEYLETLAPRVRETATQQNLRLAVYSASKAAAEFAAARRALYTDEKNAASADSASVIATIARRWVEHRLEAADHLSEALRWERQMLGAFKEITAKKKPFRR